MAWQLKPQNCYSTQPLDRLSNFQDKDFVGRSAGTHGLVGFAAEGEGTRRGANAARGDGGGGGGGGGGVGVRTSGRSGVGGGGDEGSRIMLVLRKLEDHSKVKT